jgi:hypothetical protein
VNWHPVQVTTTPDETVAAAMKKAGLVWLSWPGRRRHRPAWFATVDGSYVVIAGRDDTAEQPLPGLAEAGVADVVVPAKPAMSRVLRWNATVRRLEPGTEEWTAAAQVLRAERLNAADLDGQLDRWRDGCDLLVLEPTGRIAEGGYDDLPPLSPPPGSPATTRTRLPRVFHRRSRRRPPLSDPPA